MLKPHGLDSDSELAEAAAGRRHYAAFFLAAHTGMRRGEVLGLRWSDVDLKVGRISVRTTVVNVAYEIQSSHVKTGTGRRTIDIDRRTIEVFAPVEEGPGQAGQRHRRGPYCVG